MIVSLTLEGVRGQSATYEFGPVNLLKGRNGSGKSTIKEALCYAYAGTDSSGTRSPTHLISRDSPGLKITLKTDRGTEITRTLTQKGSQTVSLTAGGVRTTLTQAELSQKLGASPDTFLAVLLPGYFMRLPAGRQHGVLAEVMPPIERLPLIEQLAGFTLTGAESVLLDPTKRADVVGTRLTAARRQWQSQLDQKKGQLAHLKAQTYGTLQEPRLPAGLEERLKQLGALKDAWTEFKYRKEAFDRAALEHARVAQANAARDAELAVLTKELEGFTVVDVPHMHDYGPEIDALNAQKQPTPLPPASVVKGLPSSERCPTCGQVVGSKHREHVAAENAKAHAEWERACQEVVSWNDGLDKKVATLQARREADGISHRAQVSERRAAENRRANLQARIATLRFPQPLPEVPPEPTAPGETYSEQEEIKGRETWRDHQHATGTYRAAAGARDRDAADCARLELEVAPLAEAVARAERVEDALRRLPQEELARQSALLEMRGYRLEVGEGLTYVRDDGAPYPVLSTGERIAADIALSLKLDSLRKRPIGVLFLDDADLIDSIDSLRVGGLQVFVAQVVPRLDQVTVSAYSEPSLE